MPLISPDRSIIIFLNKSSSPPSPPSTTLLSMHNFSLLPNQAKVHLPPSSLIQSSHLSLSSSSTPGSSNLQHILSEIVFSQWGQLAEFWKVQGRVRFLILDCLKALCHNIWFRSLKNKKQNQTNLVWGPTPPLGYCPKLKSSFVRMAFLTSLICLVHPVWLTTITWLVSSSLLCQYYC